MDDRPKILIVNRHRYWPSPFLTVAFYPQPSDPYAIRDQYNMVYVVMENR